MPMAKSAMPSKVKPPYTTRTVCNNAFSHAAPKDLGIPKAVPHGLSFAPHALFFGLEAIVAHPAPTSDLTQPLGKMLDKLDQHGIHGYLRLKAYMRYYSDVVRKVRKVQADKGLGSYERYCAGMRLLLDGITFRDLTKAYFEVVEEVEQCAEARKRKGMMIATEKSVLETTKKRERFWKEHPNGLTVIEKDDKGKCYPFKWVWDGKLVNYIIAKETDTEKDTGTQKDLNKEKV
ncbi:hypothetical protein E8E11_008237 [Didymella keratinophila]|nr:hypothetical protein E8E11_008237 [Didymella keratinophila]